MRVLLVTNGISSTLHGAFEMVRRLERRGHECLLASHVDRGDEAAANGVAFRHLRADQDERERIRLTLGELRRPSLRWPRLALDAIGVLANAGRATTASDEFRGVLVEFDPAVVVCDMETHVAILTVLAERRPLVLSTFFFGIHERAGLPPIGSHSMPTTDGLAAEWAAVHAAEHDAARRRRSSRQGVVDRFGPVPYSTTSAVAIGRVARRLGVSLDGIVDGSAWLRPHSYRGVPALCCNLSELEFEHDPPDDWHYVGSMVHRSRVDVGVSDDDRRRWGEIARSVAGAELVVYVSLGSYWATDVHLIRRIVAVAKERSEWQLIIGLGGRLAPHELGELPDNVHALGWAPQLDALRLADVAIVHGGNAALSECVVSQVPLVVMSTGHLDQNGIAARVAYHGIGRRVPAGAASADIERALVDVTSDDAVRERLTQLAVIASSPSRRAQMVDIVEAAAATASDIS